MGMLKLFKLGLMACVWMSVGQIHASSQAFYRNFWNPTYHDKRLSYCGADRKSCGLHVAHRYCHSLGYLKADREIVEYNVGITHYLGSKDSCQGVDCHGFLLIRCVGESSHNPPAEYYYRSQQFAFPRYEHYRVDWCYQDNKGCGEKAAHSFCRRMGYMKAQSYEKEEHAFTTKALGNQKLCIGKQCHGFKQIICYR